MPHCRSSSRNASVTASIANFDALYAPWSGSTSRPPIDPTFTSRPFPLRSNGRNAWVTATCPNRLTSSWARKSSIGWNSSGPGFTIPALFTRPAMPRSPTACGDRLGGRRDHPGVGDVDEERRQLA